MWIRTDHDLFPAPLQNRWWKVSDVGSGVSQKQVDFYWGEDDPSGPKSGIFRPAGTTFSGAKAAKLDLHSS
jgi:membrane-bound lytic murein transglycosylase